MVVDLPGVGENLIDHPLVAVDLPTDPGVSGPRFQAMATVRSHLAAATARPICTCSSPGPSTWRTDVSPSGAVFGIVAGLVLPAVSRLGATALGRPAEPPRIDVGHLRHPRRRRPVWSKRPSLARHISRTEPLAALVIGDELAPGPAIADDDRDALADSITSRVESYHHPVGHLPHGQRSRPAAPSSTPAAESTASSSSTSPTPP